MWQKILAICCVLTMGLASCSDEDPYNPYANFDYEAQAKLEDEYILKYLADNNITQYTRTNSGLYHVVVEEGTGARPVVGDQVEVGYVGKFISNGTIFDSSYSRAENLKMTVGVTKVIAGWTEGLQLMRKGEKAILLIPSHLAYGVYGSGSIGPLTPIMFDMHLI